MAQAAYDCIANRNSGIPSREYTTFAKKFPALVHTCGMAQSVAFAQAKGKKESNYLDYLSDLALVLQAAGNSVITVEELASQSRTNELTAYLRLSRNGLKAASWLKRYVEVANEDNQAPVDGEAE